MTQAIEINMKDVEECAASGWSIRDTAEELDVSYMTIYKFVVKHDMRRLFVHGNKKLRERVKMVKIPD